MAVQKTVMEDHQMTNLYILRQVDILEDLETEHLQLINSVCRPKLYTLGDIIFRENSPSKEFYVIMGGEIEIQVDPDTIGDGADNYEPSTIAVLRRGQCFGEVALVDQGIRSATARCGSETAKLLVIDREDFVQLLQENKAMGYIVMRNLAADLSFKIRQTNLMVRESLMYNDSERN
ncbi:cyclic nucleotide-binding domain-containing protein [Anaerolineales bacterium HSG6]|nr:cyclic nucleotide-binding domain-containing protein [Anaerolineales bacterium HSG6]MDM8531399.1 cyclic nucleotide-binding domain-containing protein [Anaerolineales bacterium HSG25]